MTIIDKNLNKEFLSTRPITFIQTHNYSFISEGEKLKLPLGSCTSTIFIGNEREHRNILGANHIRDGSPGDENRFDAYILINKILQDYKQKYNILMPQIHCLFFLGGKTSEKNNEDQIVLNPGEVNTRHTDLALKKLRQVPLFQFTGFSLYLHILILKDLLFALIGNNEMGSGFRNHYEFFVLDLKKISQMKTINKTHKKPLRIHKKLYNLSDLVDAFFRNDINFYSCQNGLYYETQEF